MSSSPSNLSSHALADVNGEEGDEGAKGRHGVRHVSVVAAAQQPGSPGVPATPAGAPSADEPISPPSSQGTGTPSAAARGSGGGGGTNPRHAGGDGEFTTPSPAVVRRLSMPAALEQWDMDDLAGPGTPLDNSGNAEGYPGRGLDSQVVRETDEEEDDDEVRWNAS